MKDQMSFSCFCHSVIKWMTLLSVTSHWCLVACVRQLCQGGIKLSSRAATDFFRMYLNYIKKGTCLLCDLLVGLCILMKPVCTPPIDIQCFYHWIHCALNPELNLLKWSCFWKWLSVVKYMKTGIWIISSLIIFVYLESSA